ncbi:MAG TPA: cyclohexanone monooxygenase [Alphaproteobacteria bacterium]|nr:cyclohexanone monooxygenase [Alphaproteobacteria bacterium]
MASQEQQKYDVVIVGAGMAGMYMLHKLRGQGMRAIVIEAGSDVGGTWYWNRYPGCRCDVPSVEYSFSFSKELEQEWNWTEIMAAQPEILEYVNHVADRFDLRRDMVFNSRVSAASFDEDAKHWTVTTEQGESYTADFCVMATGCLSMPNKPEFPGADRFKGEVYHTGMWPKEAVDFTGKRVAVIGSGSSGVQAIPVIAEQAGEVIAIQRSPVYTFPANNRKLEDGYMDLAKADYATIREQQRNSQTGIIYYSPRRQKPEGAAPGKPKRRPSKTILELTPEQRKQEIRDFGFNVLSQYVDVHTDPEANEIACELYRETLRELVKDPAVADRLAPKNYPIGCKRPVIDTDYYLAFNRPNVRLVDLRETGPIEEITETGLRTQNGAHIEFDMLVYATGFDAMTGALKRMDITGRGGRKLVEKWEDGPRTYLGLQISGFPNMFTITGPGSPSVLSNVIVSIEQHVDWIADCLSYLRGHDLHVIEAEEQAESDWVAHVNEVAKGTMFTAPTCNSWYLGSNIPGKPRIFMPYVAGVHTYRQKCDEIAADGYRGFALAG